MVYSESGVHRIKEGKNWAYVFDDEGSFSQLGYKLIQPKGQDSLLRCARVRYNGRLKLIYFTENFQSLSYILVSLQTNGVVTVLYRLLTAILKIRDNGFLSCANVDISPECIYFDPATLEPYLIYIPIAADGSDEAMPEFEQELRRNILNELKVSRSAASLETEGFLMDILTDSRGGLEGLAGNLAGWNVKEEPRRMVMQCVSEGITGGFAIEKDRFVIGRRKDNDGVLDFSNAISRVHCSIIRKGNAFYVTDEGSSYGTFVNGAPCARNQLLQLQDGDTVRLANIEFKVKM